MFYDLWYEHKLHTATAVIPDTYECLCVCFTVELLGHFTQAACVEVPSVKWEVGQEADDLNK